jgi:hypothetical protein
LSQAGCTRLRKVWLFAQSRSPPTTPEKPPSKRIAVL